MSKPLQKRYLRPFRTSYAGVGKTGACGSRETAVNAAIGHIMSDGYSRCTVTDMRTNEDVAWLALSRDKKSVRVTTLHTIKKVPKRGN